jgi:cytoskeletal protein RodZ
MKLGKTTRTRGMLMAFVVVLLLACSARAQQEIDPTPFEVTPSVRSEEQAVSVKSAQHSEATHEMKAKATAPVVAQSDKDPTQKASITQLTAPDFAVMLVLMIGISTIVLYALAYRQFGGPGKTVHKRQTRFNQITER